MQQSSRNPAQSISVVESTQIPGTGLRVSRVALGTWAMGGWMWGGRNDRESTATIQRALDLGINLIDTAPVYGFGAAEELIGKALRNANMRSQAIIATKAGIEAMTHVLSKELRGKNITVNAIAPGPTATDLFLKGKPQEVVDHLAKLAPLERLGQPEDIANAVAFLAGPDGSWINGQIIKANGGII